MGNATRSSPAELAARVNGDVTAERLPPPKNIEGFLERYKGEIARALPRHMTPDRMARVALTACRIVPKLGKCDPVSLFGAIIQASQLGLEVNTPLGHAYLLPFENRKKGTVEVQLLVGYRGMIDLARRSGQILSISARAVHAKDKFSYAYGLEERLEHEPEADADRGPLTYVYAVARLKDGGAQFEVLSKAEVDLIRRRSMAANSGPWVTDYDAMARKTAVRRLFKFLPVSIEIQRAVTLDELTDAGIGQRNDLVITAPDEAAQIEYGPGVAGELSAEDAAPEAPREREPGEDD